MDEQGFWTIVESGGPADLEDPETKLDAVSEALNKLSPPEVVSFQGWFDQKVAAAYTWDLWGAAYLINGGCSDDGFEYFRRWLISQGRAAYEAAVANPDTLAEITDPEYRGYELEELGYLAAEVYEEMTGAEMPYPEGAWPKEPTGEKWDSEDEAECRKRLPKLSEQNFE